MDQVVVKVPALWADHHVLAARDALASVQGVASVVASARDREVRIEFDAATTDAEAIVAALSAAGYAPDAGVPPADDEPSAWSSGPRVTVTSAVDLSMSGDYRKY
jgi:copper chaperone CopZ